MRIKQYRTGVLATVIRIYKVGTTNKKIFKTFIVQS